MGQSTFLLAHGCAQQQGFLFAKPMPSVDFEALLLDNKVLPHKPDQSAHPAPSSGARVTGT